MREGSWGVIAAAWAACALALAYALPRLDRAGHGAQLLWTFFQPLAPPLLMLWLWAHTVSYFERHHVPYAACFSDAEHGRLPTAAGLRKLAAVLSTICLSALAACALLCVAPPAPWRGAAPSRLPLLVPPLLYASLAAALAAPAGALLGPARRLFLRTLGRVLVPTRPVTWADFLLADMMTSLSKSLGDAARAACLVMHGPWSHPGSARGAAVHAGTCGPLAWHFLAALVLAHTLRLAQCVSVWRRGGPPSQALNALKYLSSLPALVLTAMEHEAHRHMRPFPYRRLWLAAVTVNSLYCAYWDVEQDWDMPWLVKPGAYRLGSLRLPRPRRGSPHPPSWHAWLVASNLALRFTWAHRLLGDLEAHDAVLMAVALLEVVRRWQWTFGRVENELRQVGALRLPRGTPTPAGVAPAPGCAGTQARAATAAAAARRPALLDAGPGAGAGGGWRWWRGGAARREAAREEDGGWAAAGALGGSFSAGSLDGRGPVSGTRVHPAALWPLRSAAGPGSAAGSGGGGSGAPSLALSMDVESQPGSPAIGGGAGADGEDRPGWDGGSGRGGVVTAAATEWPVASADRLHARHIHHHGGFRPPAAAEGSGGGAAAAVAAAAAAGSGGGAGGRPSSASGASSRVVRRSSSRAGVRDH